MLQQLHIENFAIIDKLNLDLSDGMTVVTGETGAGKSIIMDALGMVLGDRADASIVPPNSDKTVIVANFNLSVSSSVQQWLEEQDLDDDGECLLKRTINKDGRSKAYINGQPTTLNILKSLAEQLVDIHGQHAHHALLKTSHQLSLLDQFARHPDLVKQVASSFHSLHNLQQQYNQLKSEQQQRTDRKTLLQYQLQELDDFGFTAEEANSIAAEHHRLANGQQLQQITLANSETLSEADSNNSSVVDSLNHVLTNLEAVSSQDPKIQQITTRIQSAVIDIEEAARDLKDYGEALELNPERLQSIEQRLSTWHDLSRKHHIEPAFLVEHHQQLQQEFSDLNSAQENLEKIQQKLIVSKEGFTKIAQKLSKSREKAAKSLEQSISEQLELLGMKASKLLVCFDSHAESPSKDGLEKVTFMFQPNPGLPAQALNKIASGGELSRISLAIQVVTVSQQSIPLMVFDEVDVGIGGGTAEVVGQLLKSLAKSAQVLCITHQPQVASQGNQHLRVEKSTNNGKTTTQLNLLSAEQQTEEIARMLGGLDITETTREHAREMLGV
jgi:DNA repair protein RecN (Recombination protein N)